jgi:predicted nucleotidyltransferase
MTPDARDAQLGELINGRRGVLDRITDEARAAGADALLLIGSLGRGGGDAFSDLDLITVPGPAPTGLDLARLFADELLLQIEVPRNAPVGGSFHTACLDVAGTVLWVDVITWPATTAAIPADATAVYDKLGLPHSPLAFIALLDQHRDPEATGHPPTDATSLLRIAVAAKYLARSDVGRLVDKLPEADGFGLEAIPALLRRMLGEIDDSALARAVACTGALVDLAAANVRSTR